MDDIQQLGGNIELSGFRDFDGGSMIILKKIIGNYAKKFSGTCTNFEKLSITMKQVHSGNKFEIHGKVIDNGKNYVSELTDHNIFFVLDKVLKKIENSMKP